MLMIVAIAWIYVVLMMSITEHTVIAGIMTFLLYCVLPLSVILYLMATPQRRRRAEQALRAAQERGNTTATTVAPDPASPPAAPPVVAASNAGQDAKGIKDAPATTTSAE